MIEDYETMKSLDYMYLLEKEKEIEEQYKLWIEQQEEEEERLPATIEINFIHKKVKRYDEVNRYI